MDSSPAMTPEDLYFYESALYSLIKDSPIGVNHGAQMMTALRDELVAARREPATPEYTAAVAELFKVVTDSLTSAVYRDFPHELINRSMSECHVANDAEEYQLYQDDDGLFAGDDFATGSSSASDAERAPHDTDAKQRKREEQRQKRLEEEELLLNKKQVIDEKGNRFQTVGPHPAPKLTVRSDNTTFLSRKTLGQKTVVQPSSPSSSSLDEEEPADLVERASSPPDDAGSNAVTHLTEFLQPLSLDSLKKLSESAKTKLRPSCKPEEFIAQIVKTAMRLGWDKALSLMDRHKPLEEPPPPAMTADLFGTLPDSTRALLGQVLGLPAPDPPAEDIRERVVAMGLLTVLSNLRLKPLKKMTTELRLSLAPTNSTEKYCEGIVYGAFPRERLRDRYSRARHKKVKFTALPSGMYTKGDMGFISFEISNISMLQKESDRHYSPEFTYASLKWSLLCMTNKESLALYLCQTGSVHCKFLITVVNRLNPDDSVRNEGTQSFEMSSTENDWGFNSVIALQDLLNPAQGFIKPETDSIMIEVAIVLVQNIVEPPAREKKTPSAQNNNDKKRANSKLAYEAAARQLLADEQAEALRKRLKQDVAKAIRDEDKTRKDIAQKANKAYHELLDRLRRETKKALRDDAEREQKEEAERQRDHERVREAQRRCETLRARLDELRGETAELTQQRQQMIASTKEKKKQGEKLAAELKAAADRLQSEQHKAKTAKKNAESAARRLEALMRDMPPSVSASSDDDECRFMV